MGVGAVRMHPCRLRRSQRPPAVGRSLTAWASPLLRGAGSVIDAVTAPLPAQAPGPVGAARARCWHAGAGQAAKGPPSHGCRIAGHAATVGGGAPLPAPRPHPKAALHLQHHSNAVQMRGMVQGAMQLPGPATTQPKPNPRAIRQPPTVLTRLLSSQDGSGTLLVGPGYFGPSFRRSRQNGEKVGRGARVPLSETPLAQTLQRFQGHGGAAAAEPAPPARPSSPRGSQRPPQLFVRVSPPGPSIAFGAGFSLACWRPVARAAAPGPPPRSHTIAVPSPRPPKSDAPAPTALPRQHYPDSITLTALP
jgi:hypothetical protein